MRTTNFYKMNLNITNRDLLRNYKDLKGKLLSGEVEEIVIPQKDGKVIRMTVTQEETPIERFLRKVKKHPLHIERPDQDIFDFLP